MIVAVLSRYLSVIALAPARFVENTSGKVFDVIQAYFDKPSLSGLYESYLFLIAARRAHPNNMSRNQKIRFGANR